MLQFSQPLPLSLYIHYPWCVQKCPYCDFNSHQAKADLAQQERAYLQALVKQCEQMLPWIWGRPIASIFFGGGTPSLISPEGLDWLMSQLRALLGFAPDIEITLEANPGTVDEAKFIGFRQAGINRLSLGIQTFNPVHLQALGRIHNDDQALSAIEKAKQAGFKNFNCDLMFALPGQSLEQALNDVRRLVKAAPPHISHYQLTLEPNTPFYRQPPILPDEDLAWEMQLACQAALKQAGYLHYEVSAFAKPGHQAQHNLNYWQFGDYLGLGAGAHGKITLAQTAEVWRTQMPASPGAFMQLMAQAQTSRPGRWQKVEADELVFEFMLNALRLQQGFELDLFSARTGLSLEKIKHPLSELQQEGWITLSSNWLEVTPRGQTYLNSLIERFLDPS
ncbi:oxygen-independent coproporphyrinogen III oxidase-like protein [Thiomicrospira microaerophila]|uniref:radical SAM family heme chaperone HemW n=1 Tax=Thiomicrospira microaerophila TaxID=406020 RepID=UPI002010A0EC|nr:radical SAM family heme chaperone HemW [Thiomicrospira microaerophila]UQB42366.1 oxygen-independent coproporphyrinogen III oxidase-like protein [Thiomicrospira microaerophila]